MAGDAQGADNRGVIDRAEKAAAAEPARAFAAFKAAADALAGRGLPAEEAECLIAAVAHGLAQGRPSQAELAVLNARALALLADGRNLALAAHALVQRADLADRRGDLPAVETDLRVALPLLRGIDYPELLAAAENLLGEVRRTQGKYAEAETQYRAALAAWRRAGSPLAPASMLLKIARMQAAQGDADGGARTARSALDELSKAPLAATERHLMTAACHELLGDCAAASADSAAARLHYQEADSRYRSLDQREAAERVAAKLGAPSPSP